MIVEPESTIEVDSVIQWYYSTLPAREIDSMGGTVKKLSWRDVRDLLEYKPHPFPASDLAEICFAIDEVYINYCLKQREANKEGANK